MAITVASFVSFRAVKKDDTEDELAECARGLLAERHHDWEWHRTGMWVRLAPRAAEIPAQGWKLHVSATSRSARDVLAAVMPVLLREAASFKFAATRAWVTWLNTANTPRASAGKFITVYPRDDAQAVRIAHACDRATEGLAGPVILSDRPVRPGSLVHYRYGGFQPATVFTDDGELMDVIHAPDGSPVPDERQPWFTPVPWATDPFAPAGPKAAALAKKAVLLNDRYLVREVLKHANKGGVYLAEDRASGGTVVIKEARPRVDAPVPHEDVIGALRHEARLLELIAPLRIAPRVLDLFEQQGHLFLVLEHFAGDVLRDQVVRRLDECDAVPAAELRHTIRRLAEMMAALHDAGVLVRDFTPNNLMLLPGPRLRIVDLELAHVLGDGPPPPAANGTPGFASPQQMAGRPSGLPDDYYSLGATIGYAATGIAPPMVEDQGRGGRPFSEIVRGWLVGPERDGLVSERVCDLVLGCMADDPAERWTPRQVLRAIEGPGRSPCAHGPTPAGGAELARAVGDAGRWLARTVVPDGEFLWPTNCVGLTMDPCNVQSGASGIGLFLCRAGRVDPTLRDLVGTATRWVSDAVGAGPRRPLGLYFGLSGSVWFLAEAADLLEDPALLDRAGELALSLPIHSFNPDITHGTAGIGLAQLHQWRLTGDARFLDRADLAAKALVAGAHPGPDGVVWPVPTDVESGFAGKTFYGFAHGNAGIAYFLLCAAAVLGEAGYRGLALDGLETLMRVARLDHDTAKWDSTTEQPYGWAHWCNGSAGVGASLVRAYTVTGDERYRRMAERAAAAVLRGRWRDGLVQCHGVAGGAELLLDLYQATGERRFHDQAGELAAVIYSQRVHDDGLVVFPDETRLEVSASFNTGLAGIGAFLFRLLHGGTRPLMVDELLPRSAAEPLGAGRP
ncbi:MAG: hypothetical protein GEV03_19435 [Streptosporangiales bacterium]|nr:hypothetical protein [Streptosporangiales bacterium]